jgi:transcriptional regulator with XRE-family HTH domain
MTSLEFKQWRASLGLTKVLAAKQLGISLSNLSLYENGHRYDNGKAVEIPKTVELACFNLSRACLTDEAIAFWQTWRNIEWDSSAPVIGELNDIATRIGEAVGGHPSTQET